MTARAFIHLAATALGLSDEETRRMVTLDGTEFVAELERLKQRSCGDVLARLWDQMRDVELVDDLPPDNRAREIMEERLRRAQRMEAIGALSRVVGHDFNNHLTTISGFTELILKGLPEADPLRPRLMHVRKAAEQAAEMTQQLMVIGNRQPTEPVDLCLSDILWELEAMLRRLCGKKVQLELHPTRELRLARLDRALIEQVLVTLANRARTVMPDGGRLVIETRNLELDDVAASLEREVPPGPGWCSRSPPPSRRWTMRHATACSSRSCTPRTRTLTASACRWSTSS